MKRLLQSPLVLGLTAVVLFFGIQGFLLLETFHGPEESKPERTAEIAPDQPARFYWDFWTPEIDAFVDDLKAERLALDDRKGELASMQARLESERLELEKTRQTLEAFRKDLEESIVEVTLTEERNLKTLAQTYTNLSPEAALTILREMDDDVVVKIMMYMKPDVIGAILEEMANESGDSGFMVKRAAALSNRLRLVRRESADNNS